MSAGGKTVWGDPAEVGKVVGGAAFDVVLDNNGKDLDAVRFVALVLETQILNYVGWYAILIVKLLGILLDRTGRFLLALCFLEVNGP